MYAGDWPLATGGGKTVFETDRIETKIARVLIATKDYVAGREVRIPHRMTAEEFLWEANQKWRGVADFFSEFNGVVLCPDWTDLVTFYDEDGGQVDEDWCASNPRRKNRAG
jgi:hypothetical protein